MGGGGGVGEQAFGIAQIVGNADDLERIGKRKRRLLSANNIKRHQIAAALHLAFYQCRLRMIGAARIQHARHARLRAEKIRHLGGGGHLRRHAHRQGFEPLQQHPGIERRQRWPGLAQQVVDILVDEFGAGENNAAEAAPLPVDVFCCRIDDAVGPQLQRALQQRRGEDIVHDQRRAACMGDFGHRRNVDHLKAGVGRTFEKQRPRVGPHGGAPLVKVRAIDQRAGDAKARQQVFHHIAAGAEQRFGRHHMVTGLDLAHQRRRNRRHAGGCGARCLGALKQGHALLEHGNCRVGKPPVDKTLILALEARLGLLHRVV